MVATVGRPEGGDRVTKIAIAVPAHWGPAVLGALRGALRARPKLSPNNVPPPLIPDATAALAALQTNPGLPDSGVVALLDFGGSGTSITLADAANNLQPIDETLRYPAFSGDQIDEALLAHVLANIDQSGAAVTSSTAAVGEFTRLREECRQVKERLSAETATDLRAEVPGYSGDIRVTRAELDQLIGDPVAQVINALQTRMQRNLVEPAQLVAVATVGGGAAIPLISQQLSERLSTPVVTTARPALNTVAGAALFASRGFDADSPTGLGSAIDPPTAMSEAAWAAGAAGMAATQSAANGAASATFRALAWSQEDGGAAEPVPYTGGEYEYEPQYGSDTTGARPGVEFVPRDQEAALDGALPWYRRPQLIFGIAATLALVATGGLVYTLTSSDGSGRAPGPATSPAVTNPEAPRRPPDQDRHSHRHRRQPNSGNATATGAAAQHDNHDASADHHNHHHPYHHHDDSTDHDDDHADHHHDDSTDDHHRTDHHNTAAHHHDRTADHHNRTADHHHPGAADHHPGRTHNHSGRSHHHRTTGAADDHRGAGGGTSRGSTYDDRSTTGDALKRHITAPQAQLDPAMLRSSLYH